MYVKPMRTPFSVAIVLAAEVCPSGRYCRPSLLARAASNARNAIAAI